MGLARQTCAIFGFLGLIACDPLTTPTAPPSDTRPQIRDLEPTVVPPSEDSKALATYYRRLQNDLLTQGLLRGDGGGPDTPFNDMILASNFVRIALFDEYVPDGDTIRPQTTLAKLRRWDQPIRMDVEFGNGIPLDQRAKDAKTVASFAARLARITGLDISQSSDDPNFHVLVLNEDDRRGYADRIRAMVPGIATSSLNTIINLPRDLRCIVVGYAEGDALSYSKAVAVIRGEHPDLLRTSCFHEELAQGLGLANDSPQARPSIFNDDEEFGLLTTHDELLLEILYDPRLQSGMTPAQAAPIARTIARELLAVTPS